MRRNVFASGLIISRADTHRDVRNPSLGSIENRGLQFSNDATCGQKHVVGGGAEVLVGEIDNQNKLYLVQANSYMTLIRSMHIGIAENHAISAVERRDQFVENPCRS